MKEKPITFRGPMVRAIIQGRKTQTRRIVKPQPPKEFVTVTDTHRGWYWNDYYAMQCWPFASTNSPKGFVHCPHGKPGDRLWVRETHQHCSYCGSTDYAADVNKPRNCRSCDQTLGRWRPSIFMFRESSRITLEILSLRVERLNDISEEDAIAEGIRYDEHLGGYCYDEEGRGFHASSATRAFENLWISIYGPGSWEANPWLWVIEFKTP